MSSAAQNTTSATIRTPNIRGEPHYLGAGAIAGIVIGCFLFVACLICICYGFRRKHKCGQRLSKWWKRIHKSSPETPKPTPPDASSPSVDFTSIELPVAKHATPPVAHPVAKPPMAVPKPNVDLPEQCPRSICTAYSIHHLGLDKIYFNFAHNQCYCSGCYPSSKADHFTSANSKYTVPRGWMRFGLRVDQAFADGKQIFKQWYTTFYGTSKDKLKSILYNRFIPFPGDQLSTNETFSTHLRDKAHVYTSPSIHYASLKHVCPTDTVQIDNVWYDVQIVLECKQNPHGIIKQRGYRRNVCDIIPEREIEWKTAQRSSVVPYGLLIRARKHQCVKQCRNSHP